MRARFRILTLLLAVSLVGPGCFVLDELDSGLASMPGNKAKQEDEPAASEPRSSGTDKKAAAIQAKVRNMWKNARTPTSKEAPEDPGEELVTCHVAGKKRFMTRTDCGIRGGKVY